MGRDTNKTGGADAMSAAEILERLERMALSASCAYRDNGQCDELNKKAIAAVAALIEREAALIAERDALIGQVKTEARARFAVEAERDAILLDVRAIARKTARSPEKSDMARLLAERHAHIIATDIIARAEARNG